MQLSMTFRHMDVDRRGAGLRARRSSSRSASTSTDPITAHAVLVCERGYNHVADVMITLPNGIVINGKETTEDMYSSIDLVMAQIERQVRRWKEKIRDHKGAERSARAARDGALGRWPSRSEDEPRPAADGHAQATAEPQIIKKSKFFASRMTVEDAVMQMNLLGNDFLVFTNAASHEVNVGVSSRRRELRAHRDRRKRRAAQGVRGAQPGVRTPEA